MKILLKSISSIDHDPRVYLPDDKNNFRIVLNLSIGMADSNGADYFDLFVCTPEWLCNNQWVPELMRHTLLVRKYDLDEITETINKYIEICTCDTWTKTAQKLSRYFAWEYEDYQS
ncbi:immunity 8 family protein [Thorsellia kenyensis]|uniref:Immunity 8 family protein n=1 Tax=Thorsellia kenyensis TaxID=1549888 RepID=A0ABV6C9V8_9GAMM